MGSTKAKSGLDLLLSLSFLYQNNKLVSDLMPISFSHSAIALCKLLQHGINSNDKRLQDIVVKGEEIFNPDEGIRTRSKSAKSKYTCRL